MTRGEAARHPWGCPLAGPIQITPMQTQQAATGQRTCLGGRPIACHLCRRRVDSRTLVMPPVLLVRHRSLLLP
jgi:hypothetical protein